MINVFIVLTEFASMFILFVLSLVFYSSLLYNIDINIYSGRNIEGVLKMKKAEMFMRKAKEMAEIADFHRQHLGCVVAYKNKVISAGCNSNKTHPIHKKSKRIRFDECASPDTIHAEIHALSQVAYMDIDWSKVTVYTYRKLKSREHGMARPCPSCMAYIKSLGIRNICYTTDEGIAYEKLD